MKPIEESPSYKSLEGLAGKQKPVKPRNSVLIDTAAAEAEGLQLVAGAKACLSV